MENRNGKYKCKVEVRMEVIATVFYRDGYPQAIDEIQDHLDLLDWDVRDVRTKHYE